MLLLRERVAPLQELVAAEGVREGVVRQVWGNYGGSVTEVEPQLRCRGLTEGVPVRVLSFMGARKAAAGSGESWRE